MKIPFSPPYIDEAVINEVVDSLRSGWITSGPKVKALEEEIKMFSGTKEVLCVNSWTSGAIMMLRWLGVKAGDEVIVPAYTYSATALAVLHAGAKPVMVDSGTDFNISVEAIRNAVTPKTKAIIPAETAETDIRHQSPLSYSGRNDSSLRQRPPPARLGYVRCSRGQATCLHQLDGSETDASRSCTLFT